MEQKKDRSWMKATWFIPLMAVLLFHMANQISNIGWKPLITLIRNGLHLTNAQSGMLIGIAGIASVIAALPAGWFANRFGAKKALVITAILSAGGMMLLSTAQSYDQALYGRVVWQFFYRMSLISTMAATALAVPAHFRGRAMGINGSFANLGAMIGAPLGAGIAVAVGWNKAFYVYTVILLVGALIFLIFYKPYEGADKTVAETVDPNAPKPVSAFKQPIAWVMAIMMFFFSTGGTIVALVPLQLKDMFGAGVIIAATLQAFGQGAGIFFNPVFGWISDRYGRFESLILIAGISIVCYLGMMVPNYYVYMFFVAIIEFLGICALNQVYAAGSYLLKGREIGAITGITAIGTGAAQFVLSTGIGWLKDVTGSWLAGMIVCVLMSVVALLIAWYLLKWTQKRDTADLAASK